MAGDIFSINLGSPFGGADSLVNWIDVGGIQGPLSVWFRNPDGDTIDVEMASQIAPAVDDDSQVVGSSAAATGKIDIPQGSSLIGRWLRVVVSAGTGANVRARLVGRAESRFL